MIVENLKKDFLSRSVMPDEVQALVVSAFEKGACAMAQEILTNADNIRKLDKFLGKIETEVELYLQENPCGMFVPIPESNYPKAVFVNDPMWFEPHNGKVGEKYVGLTGYNSTLQGVLKIKHLGGDTDYYYLIDGDGREWGVTKIATVEGFNKASNADDLWFLPSLAYVGQEVVGLTPSGQNVHGAKLYQENGIWYVKGENECVGLEVIRIAIPEVYKKMLEIKGAKDLRDEK